MSYLNKRILVTGISGLIGREILEPLSRENYEIFAISRELRVQQGINYLQCDIFNESEIKVVFEKIQPNHLLHLAWYTGENYLDSSINFDYIVASMNILKHFKSNGGIRAVFTGTCFEYKFKDSPLKETDKLNPTTVYAKCKCLLNELATLYCATNDISFAWGRVFYVYGENENERRLIGSLLKNIKEDKEIIINSGSLIKDYMHTTDIANALLSVLKSNYTGSINICSGKGIAIKDLVVKIAKEYNKEYLVKFEDNIGNQPLSIIGDNTLLNTL